ncbi:MAG TPA: UDP-N-acetylglucosamine 2-epimerase (non-hydrolyzing) [bacterium]|nr:UDP-N-acetylglucosamine 2-epimerase (non-hydrolyzing) [bacterium]HOR57138.1 UDP-N-acetylglucosamine 2-epimerase (non-hydrolyzing) [bacterium]HPL56141.1 UDP-N-acetylglucosamine 2-epimerase (non-hydrolyzing) [bacterium]
MKILTILGTRPEIIRLCLIIKKLDKACEQILVHTGQNYDNNLNDIFLSELGVRKMNYYLGATGTPAEQIGKILVGLEKIIAKEKPDRFLVLGDTNSSMGAIVAKRMAIPVYHMEAGNRCYDDRVPEEVNRRIIDHSSDVLMPYTERSRQNLLREGIEGERIYVTGNPIKEVLDNFHKEIDNSKAIKKLKLEPKKYFLATLHRQENVDEPKRLKTFVEAYSRLTATYKMPLIWSVHPRTQNRLKAGRVTLSNRIKTVKPLGLFDFVHLEKNAYCVLSDSGTVQEECAIFGTANVTIRDTTERPETIEAGSNFLSGCNTKTILTGVKLATAQKSNWQAPREYLTDNVSDTVLRILLSYRL